MTFDAAAPIPTWTAPAIDIGGERFEAVISSTITDPAAAADGDILSNLMKVTYENTPAPSFSCETRRTRSGKSRN